MIADPNHELYERACNDVGLSMNGERLVRNPI